MRKKPLSIEERKIRSRENQRVAREIARANARCSYRGCKEFSSYYYCKKHREQAAEEKRKRRVILTRKLKEYDEALLYVYGYSGETLLEKIKSVIKRYKAVSSYV